MGYDLAKKTFSRIIEFLDYLFGDYNDKIAIATVNSYRLSMVNALDRHGALSSLDLYRKAYEIFEERDMRHVDEKSHNFHLERLIEGDVVVRDDQLHYLNIPPRVVDDMNKIMRSSEKIMLRKWLPIIPENKDAR